MGAIHPAVIFFVGAAVIPLFKGKAQRIFIVGVALASFIYMLFLEPQKGWGFSFLGFNVVLLNADRLSLFVGCIFVLIGLLIILYSIHVKENEHHIVSFLYIGSSLGVVFAGDFFTFFILWEMMAVTAAVLIWLKRDEGSIGAGFRYLIMHLIGGGILLIGILLHFSATGSMDIVGLTGVPFALILTGVGFKAAFIPLHTWLPDAYPKASLTVSVFLSVFTTKAAVYALARSFPGVEVVAYMGGVMALYGVALALLQSNARKLLSYHIISQVGYMVAGVGMGTAMGVDGGLSHVWNHILYKSLLFMCIGAVIYRTGKDDLTDLGGLSRKMPITTIACIIAALSISGVPLFNGFVSKAMVYEAAYYHDVLYWMLKLASVGTFLSFCKFTYFGFLRKKEIEAREAPLTMTIPMIIVASLCVLGGIYPNLLGNILPYQSELHVYTLGKLRDTMLRLGAASAIFFFGRQLFIPHRREILDFDYIYIRVAGGFMWFCRNPASVFASWVDMAFVRVAGSLLWFCRNPASSLAAGVDSMFALVARIFVGTSRYSPLRALESVAGWIDRLSLAAEEAAKRRAQREKMAALAQGEVDVRGIDSALFLVALMLAMFLLYLVLKYLL
ncbi:Na(+)/H(+) antiporter subunit D [Dehalococcoidia bacterium]|nr:Na(+)/H(+) antiporter subunit D [Dehalococcoidia bacterium]